MGMTLSRRQFLEAMAVGGAAAAAGMRSPQLLAQSGSKLPLQASDFSYRGCFKVPQWAFQPDPTCQGDRTSFNYSDSWESPLAMRVVNGQVRFFVLSRYSGGGSVNEIALPSSLGQTIATAPTAATVDYWGTTIYGNPIRKLSSNWPNGNMNNIVTTGLLWDDVRQVLWWSFHDTFDIPGTGPTLGYAKLTTPTGSPLPAANAVAYGPFDLNSALNNTHNVNGNLMLLPPAVQSAVGGRRLAIGGVFSSILGAQDFGPNLIAFDEPQDNSIPTGLGAYPYGPSNRFIANTRDILRYGKGTPGSKDSHGNYNYQSYCRRPPDYTVMGMTSAASPPLGGAGGTDVLPQNGIGFWTNRDRVSGCVHIQTANKEGIVFSGGSSSGMNWYSEFGYNGTATSGALIGNDPRGISGWYNGTFNGGRVGCDNYQPSFYVFSVQDLIDGATLGYGHYELNPLTVRIPVSPPTGKTFANAILCDPIGHGSLGGAVFDPSTNRLYALQNVGYVGAGPEAYPVIHCWQILDTGSGPVPP